jgi:peptide/nickel transport system substrate-binding protein
MDRRAFLKSLAGAGALTAGGLPAPAVSQRAAARTIRFIPHADLANFDPIWTPAYIARNAGLLVWDTLYGVDSTLTPRRQMVEAEEVSADGLTWTFRLRPDLKFHDGEPVLARDAVASVERWCARDPMGQMIKAIANELAPVDDRTFRWSLKKPFRKMLIALGKIATPCCFVMPERIARTDPFRQITDYVGSGPARFVRGEWVPGHQAVFEKFAGYVPRPEPASWMAGGKALTAERIEWKVIADPGTASAALQSGEVDWWERPLHDLLPVLRRNRSIVVELADPLGQFGLLLMNHLYPPFNDVRARRAVLVAMSQEEYMRALIGQDDDAWRPMPGFFAPGAPLYSEEGGEILKGPRNLDAARKLIEQSGYAGEPIVCMAAQDIASQKAWGDVTADLLKRIGLKVDFQAVDWGTEVARRAQKAPPARGGWHIYHTAVFGVDAIDPTNKWARATGDQAINGWARSDAVEAEVAAWYDAKSVEDEKAIVGRLNKAALEHVVFAPLGVYLLYYASRRTIAGITKGPMPFFWGVSTTA